MTTTTDLARHEVSDLTELGQLEQLLALFKLVWGARDAPMPLDLLRAMSDAGGMVLGVFAGPSLVGGAVGFRSAEDPVRLHSHMVGVHPDWRRRGVGSAIKYHQRDWCLQRGISRMSWTFDPLQRRNAVFNINHLGAVGHTYLVDHYGPIDDALNAGVPTDRVLMRWDLDRGRPPVPTEAERILDIGEHGEPRQTGGGGDGAVRLRLPAVVASQHVLAWRVALRTAMAPRLAAGYRWTAMTEDGWCVLAPPRTQCGTETR
ncbi:GNAT family N-acetyltransferase [Kutzneria albida]|uniref:N-acetyltransferase domain-containing protein n=1 Tax=Kutzneria albida DSM 43870 TaxID=1449976 RepID=W5WLQ6_9PSEU|nr:GNAT family N-acetyltransferase [Kutzneria albida]AHH99099.1 hypothetical protein KALB_5738 [Kutzneria albida DSM 43870]